MASLVKGTHAIIRRQLAVTRGLAPRSEVDAILLQRKRIAPHLEPGAADSRTSFPSTSPMLEDVPEAYRTEAGLFVDFLKKHDYSLSYEGLLAGRG